MNEHFKKALQDFTRDAASGDAIRHLADKGMTVNEIFNNLTYPERYEQVQKTVWNYYISRGIIRLDKPCESTALITAYRYVLERDKYGHSSYRRVAENVSEEAHEYVECDFGIRLYQNRDGFIKNLECLSVSDREYVLGLPWPVQIVYHIKNDRIDRILSSL